MTEALLERLSSDSYAPNPLNKDYVSLTPTVLAIATDQSPVNSLNPIGDAVEADLSALVLPYRIGIVTAASLMYLKNPDHPDLSELTFAETCKVRELASYSRYRLGPSQRRYARQRAEDHVLNIAETYGPASYEVTRELATNSDEISVALYYSIVDEANRERDHELALLENTERTQEQQEQYESDWDRALLEHKDYVAHEAEVKRRANWDRQLQILREKQAKEEAEAQSRQKWRNLGRRAMRVATGFAGRLWLN